MTSWMAKYDAIMKGERNKIVLDSTVLAISPQFLLHN